MKPTVSFVLPVYKGKYLRQSIASILAQRYQDFELIIVNDCSPDNVKSIVCSFIDSRISYYENVENRGAIDLVGHWNNCIEKAIGKYIILASDDDIYHEDFLVEMLSLTTKYPQVDLFHCRIMYIDDDDNIIQLSQPACEFETCADFVFQRLFWNRKQAAQEFMFTKDVWKKKGGFVNFPFAWYSDDATWNTFAVNGVAYSSKILFSMRMSGLNISTINVHGEEKIEAMKQYVKWLGNFLPCIECVSKKELFEKNICILEYKNIIYSHYFMYLSNVTLRVFMKEWIYITKNNIFSHRNRFFMLLKRIFIK